MSTRERAEIDFWRSRYRVAKDQCERLVEENEVLRARIFDLINGTPPEPPVLPETTDQPPINKK